MILANEKVAPQINNTVVITHANILSPGLELDDGGLFIENGLIKDIGPSDTIESKYKNNHSLINASDFTVIPGLINSHTHVMMSLFRDICHGHDNMIEDIFFKWEPQLQAEWCEALCYAYIYDGLKSGVTCFVDHYYFSQTVAAALNKFGLKGVVAETTADIGSSFPSKEIWKRTKNEIENWSWGPNITPCLGPHASDTVSLDFMKEVVEYGKQQSLPLHFHLSQTEGERLRTIEREGMTPVEWAEKAGALSENSLIVHLVSANESDLSIIKQSGSTIGFCPASQIVYEELAPIKEILKHNIPFALGTDAPASNDGCDLLSEMRLLSLLIKDRKIDNNYQQEIFKSVSSQPAKCLMRSDIGSIEVGKSADLVFLQKDLEVLPIRLPLTNLIYSHSSRQVKHTLINGKWVLWNCEPTNVNTSEIKKEYLKALSIYQSHIDNL